MNWMLGAVGLSLALSVISIGIAVLALRASHRQLDKVRSSHRRLESELAVSNSAAIGMGNRLIAMEKRMAQGAGQASGAGASSEQDLPYTEANQLFQMGVSVEEAPLRAEASLLQAMQEHR